MKKQLLSVLFAALSAGAVNAQTNILVEDFEGGALPSGWSIITSATDGGWKFGANTALQSTSFPIDAHTLIAATNDDACNCDKSNDILVTPALDLSTYTNVFLDFQAYYFNLAYQGITEEAKIVASTDGGLTWTDVTVIPANTSSWESKVVNLTAYAGNNNVKIGFKYDDGGGWLYGCGIDDVHIYEPAQGTDLSLFSMIVGKNDPRPVFTAYTKYLSGLPLSVQVTVTNLGTSPITSFDFSWTDGTNTNNQSITGVNIAPLANYTFTATSNYTTLAGNVTIDGTISNINNGASELSTTNNAGTQNVEGVTPDPDRHFFAEEATGTWCQWCPRGAVFMDYMKETYGNTFVGIAVHNADPMVVSAYDQAMGIVISGYPSVVADHVNVIDPSDLEASMLDVIANPVHCTVSGTATVNAATNAMNIDLSTTFMMSMSGDYRFMAVVAEDSVTGTAATYNQTNAYGNNANGPMGGFESFGTSVPAASMNYNFVNRALLGGWAGQTGSIPGSVVAATPYTYSFTTTATGTWDKSQLYVAAVVLDAATGEALNAIQIPVVVVTGIEDADNNFAGSYVWPTATTDNLNMMLNLKNSNNVVITVTDMTGKLVMTQNLGNIAAGKNKMTWNVANLAAGMYNISATSAEGRMSMKFVKN